MPMKSKAQRRYLWANHPEVARELEGETGNGVKLPEHVKKAMLKSFTKIAVMLKRLPPVPTVIVEQQEAMSALDEKLKGKSPVAARVSKNPKLT